MYAATAKTRLRQKSSPRPFPKWKFSQVIKNQPTNQTNKQTNKQQQQQQQRKERKFKHLVTTIVSKEYWGGGGGGTCTVCRFYWSRRQKNEQENNAADMKNHGAVGYQSPVKIELRKGAGLTGNVSLPQRLLPSEHTYLFSAQQSKLNEEVRW